MNKYTIYCTPEQTKKALELGAPIRKIPIGGRIPGRKVYYTKSPNEDGYFECDAYYIPTTEEMIGWLEDACQFDEIEVCRGHMWYFNIWRNRNSIACGSNYTTRKEATIAAINAALKYLTNK